MNINHIHRPKTNRSTIDQSLIHRNQIINRKHEEIIGEDDKELTKTIKVYATVATVIVLSLIVISIIIS